MKIWRIGLAVGLALIVCGLVVGGSASIAGAPQYNSYASGAFFFPPYPSDGDRMGIGGSVAKYTPALGGGWYQDWGANKAPLHPTGLEYARTIYFNVMTHACGSGKIPAAQRSEIVESITGTALIDNLNANPGALWLIGNEPDSIFNCSPIMPTLYAELYHEFYTFLKAHDPTARVAIGAIVQPSPLRLAYLDKVLNHYQAQYGEKLPTDLWNIHLYALPESPNYGAGLPPDAGNAPGWYPGSWAQVVDIDVLAENLRAMRQWMANRGERDKPLIITEFGQLIPDDWNPPYILDGITFNHEVSRDYLQGSIGHFLTATDPLIGYPADGNRLVQMWAWYSLYDSFYGGDLAYTDGALTLAGTAFAQIASGRSVASVDLYPVPLITPSLVVSSGYVNVTMTVQVDNRGSAPAGAVPVRFEQIDYTTGQVVSSTLITVEPVLARYAGPQPQASAAWLLAPDTAYTLTFEIDPAHTINQTRRSAQQLAYPVLRWPDPAIESLTGDRPETFVWAGSVTSIVTATIRNGGYGTLASASAHFTATVGDQVLYLNSVREVPLLPPGSSTVVTHLLPLATSGSYVVTATLHSGDPDLDAGNNHATLRILAANAVFYLPTVLRSSGLP